MPRQPSKGGLRAAVDAILKDENIGRIRVFAQDEARLGLKPILRRVWSRKGERPVIVQRPRYEWLYVYGFVEPTTGELVWLILPRVHIETFQRALEVFARIVGANTSNPVALVIDKAGFHTSGRLVVPEGLHPIFLPGYSPQLQPAERLWPILREAIANRLLNTIDELQEVIIKRCNQLSKMKDKIKALTNYAWCNHAISRSI